MSYTPLDFPVPVILNNITESPNSLSSFDRNYTAVSDHLANVANWSVSKSGDTINGDLVINGNLSLTGNTTLINVNTVNVKDSILYLAANNETSDLIDIGIVGGKNTNGSYSHTGLIRHAETDAWYLFDGLVAEPEGNIINVDDTFYATLKANIEAKSILLNGTPVGNAIIHVSEIVPPNPTENKSLWWQASTGSLKIYYNDGDSTQWVDASIPLSGAGGGGGNDPLAYNQANLAYNQANTARTTANAAYTQANNEPKALAAFGQANAAYMQANTAYNQANAAYSTANNTNINALNAYAQANSASGIASQAANTARVSANSGSVFAPAAGINFVNSSTILVSVTAGTAGNANVSFMTGGGVGTGTVTTIATGTGLTGGPITSTGTISANVASTTVQGVTKLVNSISSTDVDNAATAYSVKLAYDNSNANALASYAVANVGVSTANAAYGAANTAGTNALNAYGQANTAQGTAQNAFGRANSAYSSANLAYDQANTARATANAAYAQANLSSGVVITDDTSTSATRYLTLTSASSGSINQLNVSSSKLSYNPSTGIVTATDFSATSDERLKDVIGVIKYGTSDIMNLNPVRFKWNSLAEQEQLAYSQDEQIGLLAQQVKEVIPEVVGDVDGYLRINYMKLIPVLIQSIKELNERISVLERK